jgi:hypothetical protein
VSGAVSGPDAARPVGRSLTGQLPNEVTGHHVEMAGTVEVQPGRLWSAAGWLFRWTLETIASESQDLAVSAMLRGIVGENLGYLRLSDLGESYVDVTGFIRTRLMSVADDRLPNDLLNREGVVEHLRKLVEAVSASTL